jgi:hypothetical protein
MEFILSHSITTIYDKLKEISPIFFRKNVIHCSYTLYMVHVVFNTAEKLPHECDYSQACLKYTP